MWDRYLFRGKRIDNGEWVQGNFIRSNDAENGYDAIIIPTNNSNMYARGDDSGDLGVENWHRVDKNTICQCTGLKDKNGKLIWENDIVDTISGIGIIVWERSEWRVKWITGKSRRDLHYWITEDKIGAMVIGNKFNNPLLLEVKK